MVTPRLMSMLHPFQAPLIRRWVFLPGGLFAAWWYLWFYPGCCLGQAAMELPLNPHRYVSASGRYALTVDPVDRFGRTTADCRLKRDGVAVWSARLPFTLREAAIGEDGTAVGYSYSSGLQGGRNAPDGNQGLGSMRLLILDPRDGHLRLREKIERELSMVMHAPPVPVVDGVLLDEAGGRFIARLSGGKAGEIWRVYRLADGHPLARITLAKVLLASAQTAGYVAAARMVPGTSLILCQWKAYGSKDPDRHFLLFNLDDRTVAWSTRFPAEQPGEPTRTEVPSAADAPVDPLSKRMDGAILEVGPADPTGSRFALWSARKRERVVYRVTRAASGRQTAWQVTEEGRTPLEVPPPDPEEPQTAPLLSLPTAPDTLLQPMEVFQFPADAVPPPAIRSVRNFAFDAEGNIGLLRVEGGHASLMLVDPREHGAVRREVNLSTPDLAAATTRLAWLEKDRWLVVTYNNATDADWAKSSAWLVDTAKETAVPFPGWDIPSVKGVSGAGDGRFVALEEHTVHYSDHTMNMPESLLGLDREGRCQWAVDEDHDTLFAPEDVTVLGDDKTAAVLETIRNDVVLCDLADGNVLRKVDLKKAWGREPTYPSEITPDVEGGFIIGDWQNKVPYVRCRADGRTRATVTPRYADGRLVNGHGIAMRVDASGQLWMSDRDSLLRLDERGQVDLVLGQAGGQNPLGTVGTLTVRDDGYLYAASARDGSVFVFDEHGRQQAVCRPARQDVPDQANTFNVAVDAARHVFLGAGRFGLSGDYDLEPPPQIEFGPDGKRLGTRQMHLGKSCMEWQFSPDGKRLLVTGYRDARVLDAATTRPVSKVTRQFDRRWLYQLPSRIVSAPDGTFALASDLQGDTSDWALHLYAADGTPTRLVRMPPEAASAFVAYDGQHIVTMVKGTNRLVVFATNDLASARTFGVKLSPSNVLGVAWQPYFVHGGQQLWLVCAETKTSPGSLGHLPDEREGTQSKVCFASSAERNPGQRTCSRGPRSAQ